MVTEYFSILQLAFHNNDYTMVEVLFCAGANVDACGNNGFTALHDIVLNNYFENGAISYNVRC